MATIPMVEYLCLDDDRPRLRAHECSGCGARFLDRRNACAACGKTTFHLVDLNTHSVLKSFTIVHRSAPGVVTPFISAVVALDGGGYVKACLRGLEIDPALIPAGLAVELVTFVAGTDSEGTEAIGFAFEPVKGSMP